MSNTEATLFIEPQEVVEWNNQLKVTEKEIEREIEKILAQVVERTRPVVPLIEKNLNLLERAELLSASARLAFGWAGPLTVAEAGEEIAFTELRHPLLALHQRVVANTFAWTGALVLTGPNTGGKTVLLKSVGLAFCLARAGLPIPAAHASLPRSVGGLGRRHRRRPKSRDQSFTFSGHLLVLKEMLSNSHSGSDLILIDEICTGTSPEEGQPLAQAFIEALLDRGLRAFVTKHYGALKQFAMVDARCRIAAMAFDGATRRPTYEILLDIPGNSSAFETAEQLGIPAEILTRARRLQGGRVGRHGAGRSPFGRSAPPIFENAKRICASSKPRRRCESKKPNKKFSNLKRGSGKAYPTKPKKCCAASPRCAKSWPPR